LTQPRSSTDNGGRNTLLEVRNLRTHFFTHEGVVQAVNGVSFDAKEGETVALVGESGCGKSVTSLSIMRLISDPPGKILSGEVLFDGVDLLQLDSQELRRTRGKEIAMIFQEPMSSLNPVLTIESQLTESVMWHLGMTKREAHARAIELLGQVGISEPERRLNQYPHEFSGGMRQRVMIGIAMSCHPKLIIADEATTALDVTIQAQILDLLKDLARQFGVTLILITHNLGVVARYADRINIMYAGSIIERGTTKEIFRNPRHPYTRGLLRSIPRVDRSRRELLETIDGQPPDLIELGEGCPFMPRCNYAIERCSHEFPDETMITDTHRSVCWVADELGEAVAAT
jgi:oligopeptide/dipeptide ABC transporter ATP-binding protein